jgi:hypothetical protein
MKKIFIKYPTLLKLLPNSSRNNQEFMWPIVNQNPESFQYVSDEIKKDKDYILSFFVNPKDRFICGINGQNLQELLNKRKRSLFLKYCSPELKDNVVFIYHLLTFYEYECDYQCLDYLPNKYLDSLQFWLDYIEKHGFFSVYQVALNKSEVLKEITIHFKSNFSHHVSLPLVHIHDIDVLKEYCRKGELND